MNRPTTKPERPAAATLIPTPGDSYVTPDGRFVASAKPGDREFPAHYVLRDSAGANILGHGHTNEVVVFEMVDVRAMIDRVLRREWLAAVQRWEDRQARQRPRVSVSA